MRTCVRAKKVTARSLPAGDRAAAPCSRPRTPARELPQLSLADALALCLLMAEQDPERFQRAGARWHARLVLERQLRLVDSQLALAAMTGLPSDPTAATRALAELGRRYGVPNL